MWRHNLRHLLMLGCTEVRVYTLRTTSWWWYTVLRLRVTTVRQPVFIDWCQQWWKVHRNTSLGYKGRKMLASLRQEGDRSWQATVFSALDIIALPTAYGRTKTKGRNGCGGQRGCESHHPSPYNDHAHLSFSGDKNLLRCHVLSIPP